MRLLHVADWHLGRRTCREPRAADHDAVIDEIAAVARDSRPDLIIHAGDLWDTARPGHDDLLRGVEALRGLSSIAPVLVVCGNHDSPALFRALGRLPGVSDHVTFASEPDAPPLAVPLSSGGRLLAAAVPYVHPNRAANPASRDGDGYRGRIGEALAAAATRLADAASTPLDRRVIGAHLHVVGAVLSSSERPSAVAEIHAAEPDALPVIDYVALGHVHRPQAVGTSPSRYAGSPLALDFGEAGEQKSVVLVTADAGEPARAEIVPLRAGRPLVVVECDLHELQAYAEATRGAICRVAVRSEEPVVALADRVRASLPDAVVVEVESRCAARADLPGPARGGGGQSDSPLDELLRDYLAATGTPGPTADRLLGRFAALLSADEDEAEWNPDELVALERLEPPRDQAELPIPRSPVDATS